MEKKIYLKCSKCHKQFKELSRKPSKKISLSVKHITTKSNPKRLPKYVTHTQTKTEPNKLNFLLKNGNVLDKKEEQ